MVLAILCPSVRVMFTAQVYMVPLKVTGRMFPITVLILTFPDRYRLWYLLREFRLPLIKNPLTLVRWWLPFLNPILPVTRIPSSSTSYGG